MFREKSQNVTRIKWEKVQTGESRGGAIWWFLLLLFLWLLLSIIFGQKGASEFCTFVSLSECPRFKHRA